MSDVGGLRRPTRPGCTGGARFFRALQRVATVGKVIFMKIIIAGGTGFLGSPLAEMYAEDGHDVRVLTRSLDVRRLAARSRHRRPGHHARRVEAGWQRRTVGGRRRRRGRCRQSLRRVARREALVAGVEETDEREPHSGDAQPRVGDHRGEDVRRRSWSAAAASTTTDRPTVDREPKAIRPAPISWGGSARTGSRKRARPNARAREWFFSGRAWSSNARAGRCRK